QHHVEDDDVDRSGPQRIPSLVGAGRVAYLEARGAKGLDERLRERRVVFDYQQLQGRSNPSSAPRELRQRASIRASREAKMKRPGRRFSGVWLHLGFTR